jgi:hypothetical protein
MVRLMGNTVGSNRGVTGRRQAGQRQLAYARRSMDKFISTYDRAPRELGEDYGEHREAP